MPHDYYPGVAFWQYPDTDNGFVAGQEGVYYNESLFFRTPNKASDVESSLPNLSLNLAKITNVDGFPSGLIYSCSTADCSYEPNSLGCINIEGTPEEAGEYPLRVDFELSALGLKYTYTVEGYVINILPENATNLDPTQGFVKDEDRVDSLFRFIEVNTFVSENEKLNIYFGMDFDQTEVVFMISNSLGEFLIKEKMLGYRNKENFVSVDVSGFSNGIYYVSIFDRKKKITQKVVIQRK